MKLLIPLFVLKSGWLRLRRNQPLFNTNKLCDPWVASHRADSEKYHEYLLTRWPIKARVRRNTWTIVRDGYNLMWL